MKSDPKKIRFPSAPKGLSTAAKAVWSKYVQAYDFDPTSLVLLEEMVRWVEERFKAREVLEAEGRYVKDRFGQTKAHPALQRDRDAGALILKYVRQLGLDLEPLNDRPGRPPGS